MGKKSWVWGLIFFILLIILIVIIIINIIPIITPILVPRIPEENGSISIYFCPRQNCSFYLVQELEYSKEAECALYDVDLPEVKNVLQDKNIPLVIDEDNFYGYGKKIVESGLMHNKFCVLDNGIITGSFNPTFNDNYKNNNNMLVIESGVLRQNYYTEFNELNNDENNLKNKNTKVIINGILAENYFCPDDNCQEQVLRTLYGAKNEIRFMVFSFTDDRIGDLLVEKFVSGVSVIGIMDKSQANDYDEYDKLLRNGINVSWDKNPAKLHHKVFIIDGKTVITGSYNPTKNGNENNDENILIIHDENIAKMYLEEWDYISTNY